MRFIFHICTVFFRENKSGNTLNILKLGLENKRTEVSMVLTKKKVNKKVDALKFNKINSNKLIDHIWDVGKGCVLRVKRRGGLILPDPVIM